MSGSDIDWRERTANFNVRIQNVIDGQLAESREGAVVNKRAPRSGEILYEMREGCSDDANAAVASAKATFDDMRWRSKPLADRQAALLKLAELIESHTEEFALYDSLEVGKPISHALGEVSQAAGTLRECAHFADKFYAPYLSDGSYSAHVRRKPIGVVAAIIGWNYPLIMAAHKVGPALIMGNSLVLKPSENTVLSASRMAELALEAGIPEGVFNVVLGIGQTVGARLAEHDDVDLLSFTGSSETGKAAMIAAGQSNMKRLMLECGGKSPYLLFDDCSEYIDAIAADVVFTAFQNQSANCMAGSRLLVQEGIADVVLEKVVAETNAYVPGDPLDPETNFGAIMNEAHLNKVLGYVDRGQTDGASLVCGGMRTRVETESGDKGYYMTPAILNGVSPDSVLAQEEIFGPVLSVMTFENEAEAIHLANNSRFGLAAYVATSNIGRAQRLSEELRAGSFYLTATGAPFGAYHEISREGHRQSGFGAEYGFPGLASYCVSTTVHQWV